MQILFITILVKRSPGAQLDIMGIHCVSKYSDGNCRRSCAHKKLLTDRRMDETDNQGYNIIRLFGPMKKKWVIIECCLEFYLIQQRQINKFLNNNY